LLYRFCKKPLRLGHKNLQETYSIFRSRNICPKQQKDLEGKRKADVCLPLSLTFKFALNFSSDLIYGQEKRRLTKGIHSEAIKSSFKYKKEKLICTKKANHALYYKCKGLVLEYKLQSLFFCTQ